MASVSINVEQITSIANSLKSKSNEIVNKYKGDCSSALEMSTECIKVSGLDTSEFFKALENIYSKVSDRVGSLADFLVNNVVAEYESVSSAIANNFTNDFAQTLSGLIPGIAVGSAGSGSSTGVSVAGTPSTEAEIRTGAVKMADPVVKEFTVMSTTPTVNIAPQVQVATSPAISGSVINSVSTSVPVVPVPSAPVVPIATTPAVPNISGLISTEKPNVAGLTSGIMDFLKNNS